MLGDASLYKHKELYVYQVSHCKEQKQYSQAIGGILNVNTSEYIKGINSFSTGKPYYRNLYQNKFALEQIANSVIINGKKRVNPCWLDRLDECGLAFWYMDDGTSSWCGRKSIMVRFCTLSFDDDELLLLQAWMSSRFGVECTITKTGDGGTRNILAVRQNSVNHFMDLVEPHIVSCLSYKIKRRA